MTHLIILKILNYEFTSCDETIFSNIQITLKNLITFFLRDFKAKKTLFIKNSTTFVASINIHVEDEHKTRQNLLKLSRNAIE